MLCGNVKAQIQFLLTNNQDQTRNYYYNLITNTTLLTYDHRVINSFYPSNQCRAQAKTAASPASSLLVHSRAYWITTQTSLINIPQGTGASPVSAQ